MEITPETKRLPQVVQEVTVQAPHPFGEGHQLTADQASFFNRMLATRIGQTLGQKHKKAHEKSEADRKAAAAKDGTEFEPQSLSDYIKSVDLQAELDAAYASFDFTAQRGPSAAPADPVSKLARQLAEAKVRTLPAVVKIGIGKLMKSKATSGTDYANKWVEMVSTYLDRHPELLDLAREQLGAAAPAEESYDDLLGNLEEIEREPASSEPAAAEAAE